MFSRPIVSILFGGKCSYSSSLTMSKCLCHKSPKDKAVFQLIRDFIVSTGALGMPPPYIKSSPKSRVVPT